ncbi:MAG: ferritin-like domain-containing protein [Gemmatimonadota bacterium]|nr:ferritin-like domain-containing protein [Gemmatimonadota bacterium]
MSPNLPDTSAWGDPDWGIRVTPRDGRGIFLPDCLVGRPGAVPDLAPPNHGLAQRGSVVDPKTPDFDFGIVQKTEVWADNIADLVEQAKQGQWNATTDIPWRDLPELEEDLERAVCQICTFMIQNEYLALYLPAKFIGRIDPCFSEVILFLSSQVMDEARHVEVFTKRALANGGGLQYVSSATEWSLQSLLAQEDFTDASFLLHVLGEGTFMELLRFLEEVSPDPVTARVFKLARQDEGRHVGYGLSHIGYHVQQRPEVITRLAQAAEKRTAFLQQVSGASPFVLNAMMTLAGGGSSPEQIEKGRGLVRDLYSTMHNKRIRELVHVGFDAETAARISELHGSGVRNFM